MYTQRILRGMTIPTKNGTTRSTTVDIVSSHFDLCIMSGRDYNARTSINPDYIEDTIIEYTERRENNNYDFILDYFDMPSFSFDKTLNNFGRSLLDMCSTCTL